jgi:hypothetical protein
MTATAMGQIGRCAGVSYGSVATVAGKTGSYKCGGQTRE